jgi:hypothetical protein
MRHFSTRHPLFIGFLIVFVTLFAAASHAQDLASITGVVTDTSGAVIPNASVVLSNDSTGVSYKGVTNSVGSFTIANVAPGPGYKVTFSAANFKTVVITGIYLSVSSTRSQNVKLTVGSESQTVEVSAAAENVTLNTSDATIGNNFQVQELNDLPVEDRGNPAALFYQQPGVTLDGAVTGSRTDQSNVTVDGLEVNDNATGEFGVIVGNAPVDSVQEFRGVTGDPLSSAGQGGGGQFDLVTKSGTNKFHGNVNEYHRDTDLEANDWFNNNSGVGRPPLVQNQFGGNIGGPIWRDRAFFFFDYDGRRDAKSAPVDRTVPLGGNSSGGGCTGSQGYREGYLCYINASGATVSLPPSQVASLDPQGIGWNADELTLFQSRYPVANDLTGDVGDLVNTAGYRFNAPNPVTINNYVQRVDFNLNEKMKIFGRGTFTQRNDEWSIDQFPSDPLTYPRYDRSRAWVVGHTWTITQNMLNQAEYGETYEDLQFPVKYNPQGLNQFGFAGGGSIAFLSNPYGGGNDAQARTYPIPVIRDDFSWEKGKHSFTFGGTFKWINPNEFLANNFNFESVGVTGNTNFTSLNPSLRPSDINSQATSIFDNAFSIALGAFAETTSNFNYNNKGATLPTGSGINMNFRYYETEIYFGDAWKLTPSLTISYGVRYQNYTPPYETHGYQAFPQLSSGSGAATPFSFNSYWADRIKQSAGGVSTDTSVPFLQYVLGGKANNAPGFYYPQNNMFAPRVAFAYSPGFDRKSVFSGGAGIVYDHRILNALQFVQTQASYLFQAQNVDPYGIPGDPYDSLATSNAAAGGLPRFSGLSTPPAPPAAPSVAPPYTPYVSGGFPYGELYGEGNILVDPNIKNPYNIEFDFGWQHEFPQGYILKVMYTGKLGRRLLASADASQLIDFPDNTGGSNQTMSQAESGMVTQMRQYASLGQFGAASSLSPQPWFEDELAGLAAELNSIYGNYFANNTQAAAFVAYPYSARGDFADTIFALSGFLPPNVGLDSQFASNSIWTNKGFSNYDGMLVTLHKNVGYGLQFDLNYTWSHSIDNVSVPANFIAIDEGFGFICDVNRPRECRGNSSFDVANYLNGTFIYELPFGRSRAVGATMPSWADELAGGWELSGIPTWHTGIAYNVYSNAFVAGFANDAPATLIGSAGLLNTRIHGGNGNPLNAFTNPAQALAAFTGPTGFNIGSRDNLRGPGYFNLDLGLGKTFPIYENKLNLKFRCDAFNAFNHPNFNPPSGGGADITQAEGVPFGTISSTYVPSSLSDTDIDARVLQGSLRVEF